TDSSERRLPTADIPRGKVNCWTGATSTRMAVGADAAAGAAGAAMSAGASSQRGARYPRTAPAASPAAAAVSRTTFFMRFGNASEPPGTVRSGRVSEKRAWHCSTSSYILAQLWDYRYA